MTDNEIMKALECCIVAGNCENCPYLYYHQYDVCIRGLLKDTLDLIKRQQAEIEDLKYNSKIRQKNIRTRKAEAIKDFAERLKTLCLERSSDEWNKKASPVSWSYAYEQFSEDVDNLVEEMVGGEND